MEVTVHGGDKLAELAKRCRQAGRQDIKRGMVQAIRAEAAPLMSALRDAIRSTDMGVGAKSSGHTGVRERMAGAIKLKVTTGARTAGVRLETRGLGTEETLPGHVDKGRWRHRVYGHDVWVEQHSERGWWTATIRVRTPATRARIVSLLDQIAMIIER